MNVNYQEIIEKVINDPRYQRYIEFGEPRSGHPEGKVKHHIRMLEENLERFRDRVSEADYWKLKFMIHVHDTLKAVAEHDSPEFSPGHHAVLARKFAEEFTDDPEVLNTIYYHDENFYLWRQFHETGNYDRTRLERLLSEISDIDHFLVFVLIDGCVPGKDFSKLEWFLDEVKRLRPTTVDRSWILEIQK
jgi:hypothetical protein